MKKFNLIAACIVAVLAMLCTGCPNDTAGGTTTTTVSVTDVKVSVEELDNTLKNVSTDAVRITITDEMPDLSEIKSIISKSSKNICLDLSECTGLTSIGDDAFRQCYKLTSVTIPAGVTSIGESAFYNCTRLASVTIPNSVKSIGNSAFKFCSWMTVKINATTPPATESKAFDPLVLIIVPEESVSAYKSTVGWKSYSEKIYGMSAIQGDYIIDGTTLVKLYDNTITSAVIPAGITSIGEYAFYEYSSLTSVTIPDSVTSIGQYAFWGCSSLTSITIPDSVTSIGDYTFRYCSGLTSINVGAGNTTYCSVGGVLFNKDKTELIKCPGGKKGTYIIPSDVKSIGNCAFYWCIELTSVTISDSVTSIGNSAFNHCGLTSVTIPAGVTSIGQDAFSSCWQLMSISVKSTTPPSIYAPFKYCSVITIYVPEESVDAYKSADGWKEYTNIIKGKTF